jgi:hypothetical protein
MKAEGTGIKSANGAVLKVVRHDICSALTLLWQQQLRSSSMLDKVRELSSYGKYAADSVICMS